MAALERAGAFLEGHFQLASGLHSDRYLEKFNLLQWPPQTELVCRKMAAGLGHTRPGVVAGPTTGGVILSYEVARQLGLRGVIAEQLPDGSGRALQRGFRLERGERALVVDDVLTTGGSVRETIEAVRSAGGEPVGVAVLVDRSGGRVDFGLPFFAATEVEMESVDPADCRLCRAGVPLTRT
ncbi:MAG: orotate phosphoribosyltransferase [Chloroflexi bacterium]|nr:orotate phosphoribosyltransferase [Chloroflexota bacterium]